MGFHSVRLPEDDRGWPPGTSTLVEKVKDGLVRVTVLDKDGRQIGGYCVTAENQPRDLEGMRLNAWRLAHARAARN